MNEAKLEALAKEIKEYLMARADEDMYWSILSSYSIGDILDVIYDSAIETLDDAWEPFEELHARIERAAERGR